MRRTTIAACFAALATLAVILAAPISADPGSDPNPGAGKDNGYGSQPGAQKAIDVGAQAGTGAASGAFGVYSHGSIPTEIPDPHERRVNGESTGLLNSSYAGNRHGNLP